MSDARGPTETQICTPPLDGELALVVFYDAAWANADKPDIAVDRDEATPPTCMSEAPKRLRVRSQVRYVMYVTTQENIMRGVGAATMID